MNVIFEGGVELRISAKIISKLRRYAKMNGMDKESGGVLIGTRSTDGKTYEVTDITFPSPSDKRHHSAFVRSKVAANNKIRASWARARGKENYLGEWHTHNEPYPHPSRMDERAARYLAKCGPHPFEHIFLLIFGSSDNTFIGMIDTQGIISPEEGISS